MLNGGAQVQVHCLLTQALFAPLITGLTKPNQDPVLHNPIPYFPIFSDFFPPPPPLPSLFQRAIDLNKFED